MGGSSPSSVITYLLTCRNRRAVSCALSHDCHSGDDQQCAAIDNNEEQEEGEDEELLLLLLLVAPPVNVALWWSVRCSDCDWDRGTPKLLMLPGRLCCLWL